MIPFRLISPYQSGKVCDMEIPEILGVDPSFKVEMVRIKAEGDKIRALYFGPEGVFSRLFTASEGLLLAQQLRDRAGPP